MTEPARRRRRPHWGTLFSAGLLVGVQVVLHRLPPFVSEPAAWRSVWVSVAFGFASFLAMRWLYNVPWAFLTGLLLPLHSAFESAAAGAGADSLAILMTLLTLAGTIAGWLLVFLPRFAWRSWGAGVPMLAAAVSLAWALHPRTGLVVSILSGFGLWLGAGLAVRLRARQTRVTPCWGNIVAALLVGIVAAGGGVYLASAGVRWLAWPRGPEVRPDANAEALVRAAAAADLSGSPSFNEESLKRWCWPTVWVTAPLMLWGFWRSLRRGWKLWARGRPPLAWVLALYAALSLAGGAWPAPGPGEAALLSLAAVAVLLPLFGVADLFRGLMERMVLTPPEESDG